MIDMPRALEVEELALRALEGGERQRGGAGVEVGDTRHERLLGSGG